MIGPLLNYTVASQHLPGLASGALELVGAVIKNAATGQIVAHVQPTTALMNGLGTAFQLGGGLLNPVGALSGIAGNIQNAQMIRRLGEIQSTLGVVQGLQMATLGVSLIGVGVTVASTAILLQRMKGLERGIERIEAGIEALPAAWREMKVRETFVDLGTDLERLDERTHWADDTALLAQVEPRLHRAFDRLADHLRQTLGAPSIDADLLEHLLAALAVCDEAQIKALFALGQARAAQRRAQSSYDKIEDLTWAMPPDRLDAALTDATRRPALVDIAQGLRRNISTRPMLVGTLIERDADPRAYLDQATKETEEPFLILAA